MEDEPQAEEGDDFYMRAFFELSTERQLGYMPGYIPIFRIRQYASFIGLSPGMMVVFETVIRHMDSTYLSWAESERKKAAKTKTPIQTVGDGRLKEPKV